VGFLAQATDAIPDEPAISAEIACAGSDEQYESLIAQARALVPECEFATSQTHWCDVLPRGVNKGSALLALLDELGEPLQSSSLILPGTDTPLMDGWTIADDLGHLVDAVLDSGDCGLGPTTIVDFSVDGEVVVERVGAGDPTPFDVE
jgi:tRNA A37 threonylcarbamoyladenosine synthetase subunit TsaC/SUA5/YrdC